MGSDLGKGGGGDVGDRGRRPWHGRLRQGAATSARAATSVTGGGDLSTGGDVGDRGRRPQHGRRRQAAATSATLAQAAATGGGDLGTGSSISPRPPSFPIKNGHLSSLLPPLPPLPPPLLQCASPQAQALHIRAPPTLPQSRPLPHHLLRSNPPRPLLQLLMLPPPPPTRLRLHLLQAPATASYAPRAASAATSAAAPPSAPCSSGRRRAAGASSTASSASGSAASSSSAAAPPSPAPPASSGPSGRTSPSTPPSSPPPKPSPSTWATSSTPPTPASTTSTSPSTSTSTPPSPAPPPTAAPRVHLPADLVLPISRNLPLDDGLWFPIQNSTDVQSKHLAIPRNAYRAVVEVYISFHQDDEFWYTNPPDSYISANNFTGVPGNGAFREVTVRLDGEVVGAVWPFTVIYTGGINPLLWRPITGIGSFDLPSYDIEITPFLGKILDGEPHEFGFGVTDALDVWYVDANLHLWLDSQSSYSVGNLIKHEAPDFTPTVVSQFKGPDGKFMTSANRRISSTGWVKSSYGKITTHFFQRLNYENLMVFAANGSSQAVNQTIDSNYGTFTKNPSSVLYSEEVFQTFPLYVYTGNTDQTNDTYSTVVNVSLEFDEKRISGERFGFSFSNLRNLQTAEGNMTVKGNLVTSGIGSTQQVYRYESTDGCYFRNVSSSNYTILYDESEKSCTESASVSSGNFFTEWSTFPARGTYYASEEN
uniref:Peptide N-acetyl-beta-D-glucosaminyl asparaginase amidase A N-terminal domain-containing protein n=1 Tax=Ananas comosus var. bracteatus TaxID=296719 RepID=A0A6V7QGH4_ANACO|nr:unnamed protein product [Ananas comosus var. bracteatus]